MRRLNFILTLVWLIALSAWPVAPASAQGQEPQIRITQVDNSQFPNVTVYVSVTDAAGVDRLCDSLFLSRVAQERDDNLLFVRERLLKNEADVAGLLDLYAQVRQGKQVPPDDTNRLVSALRLSGVTRVARVGTRERGRRTGTVRRERGVLKVRNRIYGHVFDGEWIEHNLPDAERRRQRTAYRRGLLRFRPDEEEHVPPPPDGGFQVRQRRVVAVVEADREDLRGAAGERQPLPAGEGGLGPALPGLADGGRTVPPLPVLPPGLHGGLLIAHADGAPQGPGGSQEVQFRQGQAGLGQVDLLVALP